MSDGLLSLHEAEQLAVARLGGCLIAGPPTYMAP